MNARAAFSAPVSHTITSLAKPNLKYSLIVLVALGASPMAVIAQTTPPTESQPSEQQAASAAADRSQGGSSQDALQREDQSPALGVLVGPCPGNAVCVLQTIWGSPAAKADIRAGDYILAINDQDVSTPQQLKKQIESLASEDTINVSVWRQGETMVKQIGLATEAETLPESRRAWLGISLSASTADDQSGSEQVTIEDVHPDSPADQAGLQSGDIVEQVDGAQVTSVDNFVNTVADFEPDDTLTMTVVRAGQQRTIEVTLGSVAEAPMRWFRQSYRMPLGEQDLQQMLPQMSNNDPMVDEVLDDLRAQLRALQNEVEGLRQGEPTRSPGTVPGATSPRRGGPDPNRSDRNQPADGTSSRNAEQPATIDSATVDANFESVLGQDNGVRLVQIRSPFPPNISNDWTRSRYRYRNDVYQPDFDGSRYRSYYGYPYSNYGRYYRRYRTTPYQYYPYGGRSYYYGGQYPLGYRGGVRIGPNFGVWW